jgi:hypothetical protein
MKKVFVFSIFLIPVFCFSQNSSPYRIFFTSQSAKIDTNEEAKDEPSYLTYSIKIDLNGDGIPEEFSATIANCGSGGCQWTIYDSKNSKEIGGVDGSIVYILKKKVNGFPLIETFWKLGCCAASVHYYSFNKKEYIEIKRKDLNEKEMDEYFETKPDIADEFKELK